MKKFISILMVILISMTSVSALAEKFSIRNGITFGMTFEETKEIDKLDEEDYRTNADEACLRVVDGVMDDGSIVYSFWDDIAGERMQVYYVFSSEDGLNSIIYYNSNYCDNVYQYNSIYEDIVVSNDKVLKDKYSSISCGKYEDLLSPAFKKITSYKPTKPTNKGNTHEYSQYLIEYNDYYVSVEHLIWTETLGGNLGEFNYDGAYSLNEFIIYTKVDKEKAMAAITEVVAEQMAVAESKKSDF